MNRNEIIGTIIEKTLGYVIQGFVYSEVTKAITPQTALLIKPCIKPSIRLIKICSTNYVRTDFKSETIFSDAIDASFFAD